MRNQIIYIGITVYYTCNCSTHACYTAPLLIRRVSADISQPPLSVRYS